MKTKDVFIIDGRIFHTFEEVETYAKNGGYRITNTTTIKTKKGRKHLIDITSKN